MARILLNGEWFEEIAPTSVYEAEFERILLQKAPILYPQYHLVPFKTIVYSDSGSAMADLALIEKEYREWWIVEVELAHHSLTSHVLPQVEVLSRAFYGTSEAKYLSTQAGILSYQRLEDLMKGLQPRVLVLVNTPRPQWIVPLERHEALLGLVEMFRSPRNQYLLRVNGKHPQPDRSIVSRCALHELLPNTLVLSSPAALAVEANSLVNIRYGDQSTTWKRTDIRNEVWLTFKGRDCHLDRRKAYVLLRNADNELVIEEAR